MLPFFTSFIRVHHVRNLFVLHSFFVFRLLLALPHPLLLLYPQRCNAKAKKPFSLRGQVHFYVVEKVVCSTINCKCFHLPIHEKKTAGKVKQICEKFRVVCLPLSLHPPFHHHHQQRALSRPKKLQG